MRTTIIQIGAEVSAFMKDKILILFGEEVPDTLKDFAIIHEPLSGLDEKPFEVGKTIQLASKEYKIVQVGSRANEQFLKLGHVSLYFGSAGEDLLPGAVRLAPEQPPKLQIGDVLEF